MANKTAELDAQTKGRITRLSKKTSEELINIILRKDGVEKKYAEKVKSQATELSRLYASIENYKEELKLNQESIDKLKSQIVQGNLNNDKLMSYIKDNNSITEKIKAKLSFYKYATCILGILACCLIITLVL
jgi:hypothetical protein